MQKRSARAFSNIFNLLFFLPIIIVIINSVKLQGLLGLSNVCIDCIGVKQAFGCMVMQNSDAIGIAYSLKFQLIFDRSFSVHVRHEMSICEIGEVIHENSGTYVTFGSGGTTMCRKNPGVGLTSWSTITTWPGTLSILRLLYLLTPFFRHGLRCPLPYAQPGHIGESKFANSWGIKPARAISLRMEKLRCPKRSWRTASLCCLRWTKVTAGSSSISLFLLGGKVKSNSIRDVGQVQIHRRWK